MGRCGRTQKTVRGRVRTGRSRGPGRVLICVPDLSWVTSQQLPHASVPPGETHGEHLPGPRGTLWRWNRREFPPNGSHNNKKKSITSLT